MADNFLTIEGGKQNSNFSNKWRNIVFIAIFFALVGGASFGYIRHTPLESSEPLHSISALFAEEQNTALAYGNGGDVVVTPPPALPELVGPLPAPESFTAQSIFVKDRDNNVVLYVKNGYIKRPIASITKLMTALVLLEHQIDPQMTYPVVSDPLPDSHVYAGEQYTVEQLWDAMLVASSNKAAMTLVDATNWTREAFVERMNQKAIELGMGDTYFAEPTGLDERNISTGSDIVILLDEAMKHEKILERMTKKESMIQAANTATDRRIWNTNWLLTGWVPHRFTLLGGKTGYIDASGYNVAVRLGHEDGRTLDVVILGATVHEARFTESRDIAEGVFNAYLWPTE